MLNPYNYPRSLMQWLCGIAGLPVTFLRMRTGRENGPGTLLVLCYHRIVRSRGEGGFCDNHLFINLPEQVFVRQITWLIRHYQVVGLDDVLSGGRLPPRAALITFDDGFTDIYETAWPILRFYRLPATMFLIGSVIRERKLPWLTRLHWLLDHAREKGLAIFDPASCAGYGYQFDSTTVLADVKASLRSMDIPEIDEHLSCLEDRLGISPPRSLPEKMFMSEEQIGFLCSRGWTLGNHTEHHLSLGSLRFERVCKEIGDAVSTLSSFKGYRPVLALPFGLGGSFSAQTVDAARACGMEHVFTTLGNPNRFPGSGVLLDRVICETFSEHYFRLIASGGRNAVKNILPRLKPVGKEA